MLKNFFKFYIDGFTNMPKYGRRLWFIILIKVFIIFVVLKVFFFKGHLSKFETDDEKSEFVSKQLVNIKE